MTITVALGLASRLYPTGWFLWDRILGEVLYAVAAYILWAMLLFRKSPWLIAVIAFACCLAVELFKLTGIPAEYHHMPLVRWFLGMAFDAVNLIYYFTGAVLIACADYATRAWRWNGHKAFDAEFHKKSASGAVFPLAEVADRLDPDGRKGRRNDEYRKTEIRIP